MVIFDSGAAILITILPKRNNQTSASKTLRAHGPTRDFSRPSCYPPFLNTAMLSWNPQFLQAHMAEIFKTPYFSCLNLSSIPAWGFRVNSHVCHVWLSMTSWLHDVTRFDGEFQIFHHFSTIFFLFLLNPNCSCLNSKIFTDKSSTFFNRFHGAFPNYVHA